MSDVGGEAFAGLLIVPEASVAHALGRGERAETLSSLKERLRTALAPALELAEPIAVRLALARVAPDVVAADPWIGPIARRGGRAWLRLLDAMFEALGVLVGREEALVVVARGNDGVAARARLLGRLGRALDKALGASGLCDPRLEAERLADVVAHADPSAVSDAVSCAELRARWIVEWSPSDLALWRVLDASLSRLGGRASIELPVFERPLDAERTPDPLDVLIEAVASALDDAPLTMPIVPALGDLRLDGPTMLSRTARVEVRQSTGEGSHGRAVADAVRGALAQGALPEEVVVGLVSDDEASAVEIMRSLRDVAVPAVDARSMRARGSNLTAFAELALDVAERGSPRLDVAVLLHSSYVDASSLTGQPDDASARSALRDLARHLEETPTAHVDQGGTAERLAATVLASSARSPRDRAELAGIAERVGRALDGVAGGVNRADYLRSSRALWSTLGLAAPPPSSPPRAGDAFADRVSLADHDARARDAEAWKSLHETLASYERATARLGLANVGTTLETFRHEVAWGNARREPPCPSVPGAVRLVRLEDLPSEPVKLVVIADADAEAWPDGRTRAALVFPALEDRLAQASDPAVRPIVQAGTSQALARLALATSAAERVVFTVRTHDAEGNVMSPAPVVAWLARSLPVASWRSSTALAGAGEKSVPADVARRAALERLREETFGVVLTAEHPLTATLPKGPGFEAIITDETGGGDRPLSASAVDRLASCVFRGFVSEVLRPRRSSEAHDVADAREEGNLVHAGLEAAFCATASLWSARPRDRSTIMRLGLAAADRTLASERAASDLARVVVEQVREGVRAVLEWSLADEAWDFALAEQAFGGTDGWDAVVLEQGGTRVALRGRIDRVDVSHDVNRVRVIDYKTRERSADAHTAALGTTTFQLAFYARAAETALERAGAEGLYLPVRRLRPGGAPKKHEARWADAHKVTSGVQSFERRVLTLIDDVRKGRVGVVPATAASCDYCDLDGVCRKPRFAPTTSADDDDAAGGGDDGA